MTLLLLVSVQAGAQGWYGDYSSAAAAAKSSGRPLLLIFEQEGCPDCERLEAALRRGSSESALRNAVKAKLDYSGYPRLADQFNVTATPTIVLLKVSDGSLRTVYRNVGSLQSGGIVSLGRRIDSLVASPERAGGAEAAENPPQTAARVSASPQAPTAAASAPQTAVARQPARVPGLRGNYFFYRPGGIPYDQQ